MTEQIYWEDIEEGDELPSLHKIASSRTLVEWASASNDFNPLHYEDAFAVAQGVGKPIIHGQLKLAWLVHLVTNWIGEGGFLGKISCRFIAADYPRLMKTITEPEEGEVCLCRGKVISKYRKDGQYCLECEIWVENGSGEKTTTGTALVILPSKQEIGWHLKK